MHNYLNKKIIIVTLMIAVAGIAIAVLSAIPPIAVGFYGIEKFVIGGSLEHTPLWCAVIASGSLLAADVSNLFVANHYRRKTALLKSHQFIDSKFAEWAVISSASILIAPIPAGIIIGMLLVAIIRPQYGEEGMGFLLGSMFGAFILMQPLGDRPVVAVGMGNDQKVY